MFDLLPRRHDLTTRAAESFRPPPLRRSTGKAHRLRLAIRRTVDLQFGSVLNDLEQLLPRASGNLADVGCGGQPFRDLLPQGVEYVGVDVEQSQDQFGYRAPDTRYYRGNVLPLSDREVTTVLCTETLEHVLQPDIFLKEIARALKPDGSLILTVPFAARWHFIPHDYWRFTPSGLKFLLSGAGFVDVRIYPRGGVLTVAAYKTLGLILALLAGVRRKSAAACALGLLGVCLTPVAVIAVIFGNLGLRYPGSADDTLGYTVLARRG